METLAILKTCSTTYRSYPTYEEWKLDEFFFSFYIHFCSYPTYEEWKLCNSVRCNLNIFRSYPTYEEWKRKAPFISLTS